MSPNDEDPLRALTAMQRQFSELSDPGGIKAMQRDMARLVDPGVKAMKSDMARLADSVVAMAMQKSAISRHLEAHTRLTDSVAAITMQKSAISRHLEAHIRLADSVAAITMQWDMARLANSGAIKAMQRDMAHLAELGAIRLTAQLAPSASIVALARTVGVISSGLLGTAAKTVAAAFPRHTQLAIETMSALTMLEMADHDVRHFQTLREQSPLVAAIADLRTAFADSHATADAEKRFDEVIDRVIDKLQSHASSPKAFSWEIPTIIAFLGLLVAVLSGLDQHRFSTLAEARNKRQDDEAAKSQLVGDERAAKLQRALDRLVELHEQDAKRHIAITPNDKATPANELYIVQRAVVLRERNDTRSRRLCTLHPGTVVEIIGQVGQKVQVQYFDHLRGEKQIGWVLKKYLIRLAPQNDIPIRAQ